MVYQDRRMGPLPKWPISAYKASPPVMQRNTPPSTSRPCPPECIMKRTAWVGSSAASTSGWRTMADTPSNAITRNQRSMMGPNARPIFSVPNRCVVNSTTRTSTAMGMT